MKKNSTIEKDQTMFRQLKTIGTGQLTMLLHGLRSAAVANADEKATHAKLVKQLEDELASRGVSLN